jgi:hypothetical protein
VFTPSGLTSEARSPTINGTPLATQDIATAAVDSPTLGRPMPLDRRSGEGTSGVSRFVPTSGHGGDGLLGEMMAVAAHRRTSW